MPEWAFLIVTAVSVATAAINVYSFVLARRTRRLRRGLDGSV